ncbi:MAG: AAA family ATPase [Aquabacterium sp.]
MPAALPAVLPAPSLLTAHLAALEQGLLERGTAVRLLLLTALAGEHTLLIGPPGTAKSELARRLHHRFSGAPYFERLLTRFSTPEELFGPLSLKALEADRYERLVDGWLPTAGIAFIDEVFKANSAILNALLTLLNEREFDNGNGRLPVPLISLVGASNELPADDALQAFHDRFLVRVPTAPVGDASFESLLRLGAGGADAPATAPLNAADVAAVAAARETVDLGADALAGLAALRRRLAEARLPVSDRRWRQLVSLMRSAAATEGRDRLDLLDLWLAPYVVAAEPQLQRLLADWLAGDLLQAVPVEAPGLVHAVQAFEQQLSIEQRLPADPAAADDAGKLALARSLGAQGDEAGGDGMLRMVSATLEQRLRRRFSTVHVAARLAQVDEVAAQVRVVHDQAEAALADLLRRLQGRFWIGPDVSGPWLAAHRQTLAFAADLLGRLAQARAGFAELPQDDDLPAEAPAPIAVAAD